MATAAQTQAPVTIDAYPRVDERTPPLPTQEELDFIAALNAAIDAGNALVCQHDDYVDTDRCRCHQCWNLEAWLFLSDVTIQLCEGEVIDGSPAGPAPTRDDEEEEEPKPQVVPARLPRGGFF